MQSNALSDAAYHLLHALTIADLPPALRGHWGRVDVVQRLRSARLAGRKALADSCEAVMMSRIDPSWIAW